MCVGGDNEGKQGKKMESGECVTLWQLRASGWDRSGTEASVHLDWAHTPGRCPHRVSLHSLAPKVGKGVWDQGFDK